MQEAEGDGDQQGGQYTGKLKGIRFKNLEMMCEYLDCKPGDILDYVPGEPGERDGAEG